MSRYYQDLIFREVYWPRPIEYSSVENFAKSLATFPHRNPLIWEIRGQENKIHFYLGGERDELVRLKSLLNIQGAVELVKPLKAEDDKRPAVDFARELAFSQSTMSFKIDESELLTRSTLATLASVGRGETLVFQLMIGRAFSGSLAPAHFQKPNPSFWQILTGIPEASKSETSAMSEKVSTASMNVSLRLGASSQNKSHAQTMLRSLYASLRLTETAGVHLKQRDCRSDLLNSAKIPLRFTNRLSVSELSNLFLLPTGEANFRGVRDIHPKLLLPSKDYVSKNSRTFGESLNQNPEDKKLLNLPSQQALKHLHVIGPTGSGKSVVLENLILSDIREGRGAIVIDPKYSLVQSLCEKIPANRINDVVVLDPTCPNPVGLNPFAYADETRPELLAETVMTSLKSLIPDMGIYGEKMLTGGILTLAIHGQATLLELTLLFSNAQFRKKVTSTLKDPYLKRFWQDFDKLSESEKRMQVAPLLNRLEPIQVRQSLIGILGQITPKFDLREVFTENKILLVPLNSGLVGKDISEFVASLVIGLLWDFTLKRASLPENARNPVVLYIDEFQNYLKKSAADVSEMLAMSRSLGLGFCFAHQNLGQLPRDLKETIMINARSKIVFNLTKYDAREFAMLSDSLSETDFMKLPQYQIYTKLEADQGSTDFISGQAFPPGKSLRDPLEIFAQSAKHYGGDRNEIETRMNDLNQEIEEFSSSKLTRKPNYEREKPG